jgi:hypothetical protein
LTIEAKARMWLSPSVGGSLPSGLLLAAVVERSVIDEGIGMRYLLILLFLAACGGGDPEEEQARESRDPPICGENRQHCI